VTSSKSARRTRREERRRRAEPRTEPLPALRTAVYDGMTEVPGRPAGYDATVITFGGMSAPGLPDADITAAQAPAQYAPDGRPAILIGDALAREPGWADKFAILPCGHCGAGFGGARPADLLHLWNPLMTVKARAWEAGWRLDYDHTLTCTDCQQTDAWKARQGQVTLRWPDDGVCDRHDLISWATFPGDEYRCTCPGAVLATDVMLASEDHLGSGRGRHRAVTR
jgi:hypothetical protein